MRRYGDDFAIGSCTLTASTSPSVWGRSEFRAEIEGLRAVAILLVVLFHAGVPGFAGGYVGVDVFFVLSGYLITGLLVREIEANGTISFAEFYARRARRLFPALAVTIAATILVASILHSPIEQRGFASTAFATAAYLSNVEFARGATDYLGQDEAMNPLLHTWSLSVEEQFYLGWPLLLTLALASRRFTANADSIRSRLFHWIAALGLISFCLSLWMTDLRQPWAFFLTPFRAWEFAVGGLAVLVTGETVKAVSRRVSGSIGWLGLAGIFLSAAWFNTTTTFPGVAALLPVVSTAAVLCFSSLRPDSRVVRLLGWGPLQELGRLSYSWYLWHWPVLLFAQSIWEPLPLPFGHRLAAMGFALGVAKVSYHLVEMPFRHHPILTRKPAYALAMAAIFTILTLGASLVWRQTAILAAASPGQEQFTRAYDDVPTLFAEGCHSEPYEVAVKGCTFGETNAPVTIVLLGDSHAAQWFPAVRAITQQRGWRFVSLTKTVCPALEVQFFHPLVGREYRECEQWRQSALDKIRQLRPKMVIASSYTALPLTDDEWRRGTLAILKTLSAAAESVVMLRDVPTAGFDVPACLARSAWTGRPSSRCDFEQETSRQKRIYRFQQYAAGLHPNVYTLDLTKSICPARTCKALTNDVVTYRDAHHRFIRVHSDLGLVDQDRRIDVEIGYPAAQRRRPPTVALSNCRGEFWCGALIHEVSGS